MSADKDQPAKPGSSPFNRTVQHDAKRSAILSQAAKLFNGRGSRATTLLDIAQSLGLTKTSLYYYVKTKEDLIYQCYVAALEHQLAGLDQIEKAKSGARERLSAVLRAHFVDWREAHAGRRNHTAALMEIASLKDQHREDVEKLYTNLFLRLRQYFRDGIEQGSIRPLESTAATLGLIGSMNWSFNWLRTVPMENLDAVIAAACDLLENGLSNTPGEYRFNDLTFDSQEAAATQGFDREQQNRLKQDAFYRTGTWFFNKKGFAGTSLDEIAETLNVTKGAFYYHIKNKEDLLYNCYTRSLDIQNRIHEEAQKIPTGIQRLEYICRDGFHVQNSENGPLIRYNSITALPGERRRDILEATDNVNARFGQCIQEGIDDGSVRQVQVDVCQELITGAMNASMDLGMWRKMDNVDQASKDYYDLFFNGLKPRIAN